MSIEDGNMTRRDFLKVGALTAGALAVSPLLEACGSVSKETMKTFYFTATGNSLAVAKAVGGELISLAQIMRTSQRKFDADVIGLVFPVYCCNLPQIVRDFIREAHLRASYFFAVATYGNAEAMGSSGDGAALEELDKLVAKQSLSFSYMNSILMVDNFVDNFSIEEEISRIPSKEIDEHLASICADIKAHKAYKKDPGKAGRKVTEFCIPIMAEQDMGLSARKFSVDESCIGCGTCSRVCPYDNISINGDRPSFGEHCLSCYACIHSCPRHSLHIKNERSSMRWRNPDVSLKDIISANGKKVID